MFQASHPLAPQPGDDEWATAVTDALFNVDVLRLPELHHFVSFYIVIVPGTWLWFEQKCYLQMPVCLGWASIIASLPEEHDLLERVKPRQVLYLTW